MANEEVEDDKPLELPIKTTSSKHRDRVEPRSIKNVVKQDDDKPKVIETKFEPRDPRFDPRCSGSNDRRHFVRNYAFLNEVKKTELNELQKALKREHDEDKKAQIKMAISRYRNKMIDQQQELNPQKARGKFKKLELASKFKELKETGKLTKYLERKRKKLLKRDMKSFG